jgi:predicted dehydrogenase
MSRTLRVGVVGVGSLGQWHARVFSELPQAQLVGVCDADPDRAAEIAARYGTRAFASPEALAGEIEAASVAVPADRHAEVACPLLERGLHLLVEKPIAATVEEAERMLATARRHHAILQVGHVERFNPVMAYLESVLTQPRFVEATRLAAYPPPRVGLPPRGTEVSVVLDLMIHDLEIILHLVRSPVKEIHAIGVPVLSPTEDLANARLVFGSGAVASLTASRVSAERMRRLRVFQSDAFVSLDYANQTGTIYRKAGDAIERSEVPIEKGEPLARELAAFVRCVRSGGRPVVGGEQAADALRLATAICHQIRESPS